ncbi:DUF192 domain-containing protein [candidate division KSB1 bacterium]
MRIHKFIAVAIVTIFIGVNAFIFSDEFRFYKMRIITPRGDIFNLRVELAKTFRQKKMGLMNRRSLRGGRGMLFVYKKPLIPSFWMKDMRFPLDMIFIGEDLTVKHIQEKVMPCLQNETCSTYSPPEPIKYVLEVTSGYSYLFKIRRGDIVEFIDSVEYE